jgi:putative spermidine/putrescine transport system ATP-binding protein
MPQATAASLASPQPLTLDGVTHSYGGGLAVDDVTLEVKGGDLVALLGPSGCGKTTLLRIIAGFLRQTSGNVVIGEKRVDDQPPNLREVGIVFQNYALFPHMTVAENIAYGLAARGESRALQSDRVAEMLATVRMSEFADRKPRQLSGGQQQRVALARALAVRPRILLLDEPFAALDKNLRLDMQIEIKRLQRQFGLTAILVTHDQDEAMSIADKIAVMNKGRIEQLGSPVSIYDTPHTLFVNSFIGSSNLFPGVVETTRAGSYGIRLDNGAIWPIKSDQVFQTGDPVVASVRPEQLTLSQSQTPARFPVNHSISLPIGGSFVHDVRDHTGATLKVTAARLPGASCIADDLTWCGLAEKARPALFAIPKNGSTQGEIR